MYIYIDTQMHTQSINCFIHSLNYPTSPTHPPITSTINLQISLLLFFIKSIKMIITFMFLSLSLFLHSISLSIFAAPQGQWFLIQPSIGISAMHMQLLHNNKVIIFDRTDFGTSNLSLPNSRCRYDPLDNVVKVDCSAHSVLYDIVTNTFRPLMVQTDTWCSSGTVLPNGSLLQTGGFNDGDRVVRMFTPCDGFGNCDWVEFPGYLGVRRWYATNQILPNGDVIVIGGRRQFSYEFYPRSFGQTVFSLPFLQETSDVDENNLYPFVHLLPDGNLFVFANTRSISLDYRQNRVVKEFPPIPGGDPRNYPSSGSAVLLPIVESKPNVVAEIMVCGGAPRGGFSSADSGTFLVAVSTCGRITVTDDEPSWTMESMPMARVMGDMLLLPNDDIIIINGAEAGTAGWERGQSPATRPVIYHPIGPPDYRFSVMSPSPRPRLYHSSAILLADGRILVGGSNPHVYYNFTGVEYPTDLSLEAYIPPYLGPEYDIVRPKIMFVNEIVGYEQSFVITFVVPKFLGVTSVRIMSPSFTTHSFAMNQRMVVLRMGVVTRVADNAYSVTAIGPSKPEIAPPGYYLLFVVHVDIPSVGMWVKLQ